jgi:uridine kinase
VTGRRAAVVVELAALVCGYELGHPTRVAIDGVSAAGKSTLAGELAEAVAATGRPVVHLTMDGYHHPRAHRHRQGRLSAAGYYEDAFDVDAFAANVLAPLGPGGDRRYRERIHDLATDDRVDEPPATAAADAVLVVDGSFLQRPELAPLWDVTIFVETSFDVALARGLARDAGSLGGREAAEEAYAKRYHAAARTYIETVRPAERATAVVENDDLSAPVLRVRLRRRRPRLEP